MSAVRQTLVTSLTPTRSARDTDNPMQLERRRPQVLGQRLLASSALLALCAGLALPAAAEEGNTTARQVGDVAQFAPALAGAALALGKHDDRGLGQLALASASTLIVVHTLKPTINRTRPDGGSRSFPSGHTAMAFAGAGFVHLRYGWRLGIPAYAVGVFVGWSRVDSKQHHTSDVVAAGAIGIAANVAFTRRFHRVSVSPTAGAGRPGLTLTYSW
jgi:membrane-associated phospholipid phosphatase